MTEAVAQREPDFAHVAQEETEEKPRKRKPRPSDSDRSVRLEPDVAAELARFTRASVKYDFIESRRFRRPSRSRAIRLLLRQEWAQRVMREHEEAKARKDEHRRL